MTNPSPREIKSALKAALGDRVVFVKGASTRGRPWSEHNKGLAAHIFHHTANPHATGNKGAPSLEWCINAGGEMPFCNAVAGRGGKYYVLSLGSCWHSGYGGPWPSRGFPKATDNLSAKGLWGVEIDDPGTSRTITPAQIESTTKAAAALADLCGWDQFALVTHGDWTDAGPYLMDEQGRQEGPYGPNRYRKNDTNRNWYPGEFWRHETAQWRKGLSVHFETLNDNLITNGEAPKVSLIAKAMRQQGLEGFAINDTWGGGKSAAYCEWQKKCQVSPSGLPDFKSLNRLARKSGMFWVVP